MSEVLVVGAGALGLATAEALLLAGAPVTVLERGEVGREASWAGGGILSPLCPWDYPDEVTRLALRGAARFGDWAQALHQATGIDPEFVQSGMRVLHKLRSLRRPRGSGARRMGWFVFLRPAGGVRMKPCSCPPSRRCATRA